MDFVVVSPLIALSLSALLPLTDSYVAKVIIINLRPMRERVTIVCLSVCVCVCLSVRLSVQALATSFQVNLYDELS